ncbi:MAG: RteC domain-containing protein [Flavobacteriales bacterium]|nr:RteC domain-containing protein [Flavobacteriales bacterium]
MKIQDYSRQISSKLEQDLSVLTMDSENKLIQFESAFYLVDQALERVKAFLATYEFASEEEEIQFFKNQMTEFLKESMFYSELFNLESSRTPGTNKELKRFYETEQAAMGKFLQANQNLYNYLLLKKENQDKVFFLRSAQAPVYKPTLFWHTLDTRYCTVYTLYFARIKGTVALMDYIHEQLRILNGEEEGEAKKPASSLNWTGKKVELVELIYALRQGGVLNHGRLGLKQIASHFEKIFGVNLQDFYRTYNEITFRKKSRTAFLDFLKDRMEEYIEKGEALN